MSVTTFEIKYETEPTLPPPFCYYYHIHGQVTTTGIQVVFAWVYHNREDITPEELEEEGFTGEDDFTWQGSVDKSWLPPIQKLLAGTKTITENEEDAFLELNFQVSKGTSFQGRPHNTVQWMYFLQEFIQGIYETAEKEAPLRVRYKKITPTHTFFVSLKVQFADRKVWVQYRLDTHKMQTLELPWDTTHAGLQALFALDYYPDNAEKREPNQKGTYVDIGENIWYALDPSVGHPTTDIREIEKFFDQWKRKTNE